MMSVLDETIERLLAMSDGEFEQVVNDDTRHTEDKPRLTQEVVDALRSPEVTRRWYSMLLRMTKNIEGQFAAKTADHRASVLRMKTEQGHRATALREEASFERWRAGALRVKAGLEVRLLEARYLLALRGDTHESDLVLAERNAALGRVGVLEEAIRRHRSAGGGPVENEILWSYIQSGEGSVIE